MDDFLFGGRKDPHECEKLMLKFESICSDIGVPIANKKTEGPSTVIEYLGLTIDTINMLIKIPDKQIKELLIGIETLLSKKKVTLKELQSICGSLAFCKKSNTSWPGLPSSSVYGYYSSFKTKPFNKGYS